MGSTESDSISAWIDSKSRKDELDNYNNEDLLSSDVSISITDLRKVKDIICMTLPTF